MNFTVEGILLSLVFSVFGTAYFVYGKKRSEVRYMVIGVLLMGYTYFVDSTGWTIAIGVGLSLSPFIMNKLGI